MKQYLSISKASEYLHVHPQTLRKWEQEGKIVPYHTEGGQRRYTVEMLDALMTGSNPEPATVKQLVIGYCRVSTSGQKDDLQRQIKVVQTYCEQQGKPFEIVKDTGSGLNYKRPGLKKLIHLICSRQCSEVVVNYQDRLVRFGFELIKQICIENNVSLTVINQTQVEDPNQEIAEDVLSIITVYSAKLYGRRSHKNAKIIKANESFFSEDR